MKQLLRKWLGIIEQPIIPDRTEYVKIEQVRELIEQAIYEALSPQFPAAYVCLFWQNREAVRGVLARHLKRILETKAQEVVKENIKVLIEPETFIDEIVERIKKKQLN